MKPFSQACENNKKPIVAHLKNFFADRREILEVGSGTGQHAVYFGEHLPHLRWQCGDLLVNHDGIQVWLDEASLQNVLAPVVTDADLSVWDVGQFDGVFSANTFHIMSWPQVQRIFRHLDRVLMPQGKLAVYGPFNYNGQFTSESNARFDQWLKQNGPHQGVRDFEEVDLLAREIGLTLVADHAMPANNRLLCWVRKQSVQC